MRGYRSIFNLIPRKCEMVPRILFLNKAPPYQGTGAETVIWELGTHLADCGWDVHYLCPLDLDETVPPSVENVRFHGVETKSSILPGEMAFFFRGIMPYSSLVKQLKPDIVYDNASPLMFAYAHFMTPDLVVTKVHGINGRDALVNKATLTKQLGTMLGDQLYRFTDGRRLLTVSESTRTRLKPLVSKFPDRIQTVFNGVNPDMFEYSFSPEGPILSLCTLTPRKNISSLLRAWQTVEDAGIERILIIAGDGPQRDNLEALCDDLNLSQVEFRGYVSDTKKRRLLREAYCYVLPTRMEGFGLSNLEAMASGCVVISTAVPGVRDYLIDGHNGLVAPPENDDALASALHFAIENRDETEPLTQAGLETVQQDFHVNQAVERERRILSDYV